MPKFQKGQGGSEPSSKARGDAAENQALALLQSHGLRLLARNYRLPGRGAPEIDLIMQTQDGTVVFVEVRQRSTHAHGGAGASISLAKRRRIVRAAQHYLLRWSRLPAVRLDAVLIDGDTLQWLPAAFDADGC